MTKRDDELRARLIEKATQAGSIGFMMTEITGCKHRHVDATTRGLVKDGLLFKGKIGHRTVRFFAEREWAEAYERERKTRNARGIRLHQSQGAIYPEDENGKPLYKFTKCESKFDSFEAQLKNRTRWNGDAIVR